MRAVDIMSIARLWPVKRGRRAAGSFSMGLPKRWQKTPNTALSSTIRRSHHAANASPAAAAERDTPATIGLEGYSRVAPSSVPAQKKIDGVATREFAKIHRRRRNYRSGLSAWLSSHPVPCQRSGRHCAAYTRPRLSRRFDLWLIDDDCCDETVFFGANGIGYGQLFFRMAGGGIEFSRLSFSSASAGD